MKVSKVTKPAGRKRLASGQDRARFTGKGSRVVSATEAARSFSELLDRVWYRGETFVIERGGEPVCEISHTKPLRFTGADFLALLQSLPKPDPRYWRAVKKTMRQKPVVPSSPWER